METLQWLSYESKSVNKSESQNFIQIVRCKRFESHILTESFIFSKTCLHHGDF